MQIVRRAGHAAVLREFGQVWYAESQDNAKHEHSDQELVKSEAALAVDSHQQSIVRRLLPRPKDR